MLPLPMNRSFAYECGQDLPAGAIVKVPFGARFTYGIVWGKTDDAPESLKPVAQVLGQMPAHMPQFIKWVAEYNMTPLGMVLRGCLPKALDKTEKRPKKQMDAQAEVCPITLTPGQQAALEGMETGGFKVNVLNGVTGSGKTEVYLKAAEKALKQGKQALVMVPEIALTSQLKQRFAKHFDDVMVWHSSMTDLGRGKTWQAAMNGDARVFLGTRSALFLPLKNLGLIVVDEEHDHAYKQEDAPIYHGRDAAVMLGKMTGAAVVLASATPSLETMINAQGGKYAQVFLDKRYDDAVMPQIIAVDMRRQDKENRVISQELEQQLRQTFEAGQQSIMYLNRRGHTPLILCGKCGQAVGCPDCASALVWHEKHARLMCHYCGHNADMPQVCALCTAEDKMISVGFGVEKVARAVQEILPDARVRVMASDYIGKQTETIINQMTNGEIDVLVGTQMLAKGYNFPQLTLVGIIDADFGANTGDLRAAERSFQVLTQVAGRAGRLAQKPGKVVVQSHNPDSAIVSALLSGNANPLWAAEIQGRQALMLPPFGWLAAVIISGPSVDRILAICKDLSAVFAHYANENVKLLGPAPAVLYKLRGQFRYRFLLKTARSVNIQALLADWLKRVPAHKDITVRVDINPYSFM
ncbi:MAG: primosomal protein N' [Alphaproteobacteria bacterium]|nr:primosomal protein N' [Alphaproteobacteria bacterium]